MKNFFINSIQFNSIQFNWVKLFSSKLKAGMVLLFGLTMYACSDKEAIESGYVDAKVENRETNICDFVYCNPDDWVPKDLTINYLGCPFKVTFEWRKCEQGAEVRNFDFEFDATNGRCNTIIDSIGQFWLNNQSLQANIAYNSIYKELTLQVQDWVLSQLERSDFGSNPNILWQFIETDCHTLCVSSVIDFEQNVTYEIGHVKCGESCCVRSGGIRFDENDNAFLIDIDLEGGEPCEATLVNCSGSYNPNICTPACERL